MKEERNGRTDEEMVLWKLKQIKEKDPGACAHLQCDPESGEVLYILIQTSDMRVAFHKFPEVIITDITYRINKNRMPVSVIEVMNGEGEGEVVGYAFLANEMKDTLTAMLFKFVGHW